MAKIIFIIISLFLVNTSFCQFKKVAIDELDITRVQKLKCLDSNSITTVCEQDLENFEVEFYKVLIDEKAAEMRLIGRACSSVESNSGLPGVLIYTLNRPDWKIYNNNLIGDSGRDNRSNRGFFDITVKLAKNQSLIFYSKGFYINEYNLSKFLK